MTYTICIDVFSNETSLISPFSIPQKGHFTKTSPKIQAEFSLEDLIGSCFLFFPLQSWQSKGTPPKATPPQVITGNHWVFIVPDHKAGYFLGLNVALGPKGPLDSHDARDFKDDLRGSFNTLQDGHRQKPVIIMGI